MVLITIWVALALTIVIFVVKHQSSGGVLTLSYFFGLSLIHVPGLLVFLSPSSGFNDQIQTELGFKLTLLGIAAFFVGIVVALRTEQQRSVSKELVSLEKLQSLGIAGSRLIASGLIMYFGLVPLSFYLPSLTSIIYPFGAFLIIGFWLSIYSAVFMDKPIRLLVLFTLLPLLPIATLAIGGFIGYGVFWVISIVTFLFAIVRYRFWFYIAMPVVIFLGLSLFVTYMGERSAIRDLIWQEKASLLDRFERVVTMITHFQVLNLDEPRHLEALDQRLNQNAVVGDAVQRHEDGFSSFVYGDTVPLWAFIPRSVWPDKPSIGGGGTVIRDFTGRSVAEGTSYGAGQVLEFYINFGLPGVFIGFFGLGYILMRLDVGMTRALGIYDLRGFLIRAMPGVTLLNPNGNLVAIVVSFTSAYFGIRLLTSITLFNDLLFPAGHQVPTRRLS